MFSIFRDRFGKMVVVINVVVTIRVMEFIFVIRGESEERLRSVVKLFSLGDYDNEFYFLNFNII